MPTTSPHNLYYPDETTDVAPLHPVMAAMQTSTEAALTTMDGVVGGHTTSIGTLTTQLAAQGVPWFATTGARDAAIPTPSAGKLATTGTGATTTLWEYNGTAWVVLAQPGAWSLYTPTWTNLTVGNGTVNAAYSQVGKTVHFRVGILWGTTTSASGNWYPSLPVPVVPGLGSFYPVSAWMFNSSPSTFNSATFVLNTYIISATAGIVSGVNPWAWGVSDRVYINGSYEAQ